MLLSAPYPAPTRWSPRRARTAAAVSRPEPTRPVLRAQAAGLLRTLALRATGRALESHRRETSFVREQLDAYSDRTDLDTTITVTPRGVRVEECEPLGVVALICEPSCPTLLLIEHVIAALAAGNAVAIALLEPADALFELALLAFQVSHAGAFVVVSPATGNDWSGVPECTVIVLTRDRIHVNGTSSHVVEKAPSDPASRRALIRLYSTTTRYVVGIDVVTSVTR
jgi:acyl-CoA reductase-like NAD-dependent aldehyde dehydrogenase